MSFTIILISLLALGILILTAIVWKKLPQLRIVDPKSSPESKSRELKNQIIKKRLERIGNKRFGFFKPLGQGLQNGVRRFAGKLTAVERRYQEKRRKEKGFKLTEEMTKEYMEQAKKFANDGMWDRAEKKYIEIISSNPKYTDAYEQLGRLYLSRKDYNLARETFDFLLKLEPKDASVLTSLGEISQKEGKPQDALRFYKKAVKLRPKNPKYLDFLIQAAIEVQDRTQAMSALDQLKNVNPDNKKIKGFEEAIAELPVVIKKQLPDGTIKEEKTKVVRAVRRKVVAKKTEEKKNTGTKKVVKKIAKKTAIKKTGLKKSTIKK